jgi:hypothetical protein
MKPKRCAATEKKKVRKAVYKQFEAEETRMYAAKIEEALESGHQQECILSGGVYLRHRLKKPAFQKICLLSFPHTSTTHQVVRRSQFLACGMQAFRRARSFPLEQHSTPMLLLDPDIMFDIKKL